MPENVGRRDTSAQPTCLKKIFYFDAYGPCGLAFYAYGPSPFAYGPPFAHIVARTAPDPRYGVIYYYKFIVGQRGPQNVGSKSRRPKSIVWPATCQSGRNLTKGIQGTSSTRVLAVNLARINLGFQ